MNPVPALMEVRSLSKIFTTEEVETHALFDVTFSVSAREFVTILGPSGCGKSTLLSILAMMDSRSSGSYHFEGRDVSQLNRDERTGFHKCGSWPNEFSDRPGNGYTTFHLVRDYFVAA